MSQNGQFWNIGTPCGGSKSRLIGLIFQKYYFDIRMKRLKGGEWENEDIFKKRVPLRVGPGFRDQKLAENQFFFLRICLTKYLFVWYPGYYRYKFTDTLDTLCPGNRDGSMGSMIHG